MKIWNGLTSTRKNLNDVRAPDHSDYLQLVTEIQKVQDFVSSLSQNTKIMPNLEDELQKAYDKVDKLLQVIQQIIPPKDLKESIKQLNDKIIEVDTRRSVLKLQQELESVRNQVTTNQIQVLKLQANFAAEVKGFQNKVWTTLTELRQDVIKRLDILEKRVESLSLHVDVAKLLGQLNEARNS